MKTRYQALLAFSLATLLATPTYAHDSSEHEGGREAPDCAAMKNMEGMGGMDSHDPVMMAMMAQCTDVTDKADGDARHHEKKGHDHEDGDPHHHDENGHDHDKK